MRALLLIVLLAAGGGYVYYQRQHNYPLNPVTTPAGLKYEVRHLPDECVQSTCIKRVVYLSKLRDSTALIEEARGLLPWVDANVPRGSGPQGLMVVALEPGFLRIGPPRRMVGLVFGTMPGSGWRYLAQEDMSGKMAPMFE